MRRSGVSATINVRGRLVSLDEPQVMGILNVTPDSFFATSRCRSEEEIRQRVCMMRREGATMVDIGAYSSRPGAEEVSVEEELRRLLPAVGIVREEWPDAIISVDTFRAEVARQAVEAGADIINDISGGEMDKDMFRTVAELHVPYILMHMQGTPQDMQKAPHYDNLMCEVFRSLGERVEELHEMGVADVIVDPGFGFGKTMAQNYEMMARLGEFRLLGCPILVGISRKSMIYRLLDATPEESLNGTTALNTIALMNGASILRVHDVKEAVEAVKIYRQCLISD
ncbi:MAG: dihydropteroate synthase [Bacteroidaceae bacterium]|nr:dihydropteroate synthase [Bacteroidaceae bacterium]